jgi:peptide/nickel transport system substrate-binding protein
MSSQSRVRTIPVLFLIVLLTALVVQSAEDTPDFLRCKDVEGRPGGNLVVSVTADPATFNRMLATSVANASVTDRLSADLVHINRLTFELEPSLAKRWDVGKDGKTYTIHLRRGLRFSDGSPFSADDVLFTFQALFDPATETVLADQLKTDGGFPSVSKIDSHTIRLVFPRPVGMNLRALASIPVLPRSRLLRALQGGAFNTAWGPSASPGEIVGMGPFRFKEYQRGVKIVLEKNPYYWKKDKSGNALPYLDTITFLILRDRNSEALRFQAGEIDLLNSLNAENFANLRRAQPEGHFSLRDNGPGLAQDYLWFNLNPGKNRSGKPFVDPEKAAIFARAEFRRAVSHALDREGMARSILLSLGSPQYGSISSGNKTWYYPGIPRTQFDPERSRMLLAQLGLRDSDGDGILEIGASRRPFEIMLFTAKGNLFRERSAQVIKENLARIGLRVTVQAVPPNELVTRVMNSYEYEVVLFGFDPQDVAPDLQTDVWYSFGRNHFWNPGQAKPHTEWEAEIDRLTSRLVSDTDPAARKKVFVQIQEIWARELPAIATLAPNVLTAWNDRVGNVRPSILAPQLLWNAEELTLRPK